MSPPATRPTTVIDRRAAAIVLVVVPVTLVALATWLVPWDWVPGGSLTPADAGEVFTAGQMDRIERFTAPNRWWGWSSYAVSMMVALLLGLTHWGARLVRALAGSLRWWLAVPVGTVAVLLVGRLATLPFSAVLQARRREFGLSRQPWVAWFGDVATGFAVSALLVCLLLLSVVALARWSPRRWFLPAGAVAGAVVVGSSFLYPVLVEPLFNDFRPLAQGPFRTSVLELAEREGVKIDDVLVADASRRTTSLNAYVSGFAGSRRVVLYDNLVEGVPAPQARVIVAHELAHARNRDVLVGTVLGAVALAGTPAVLAAVLSSRRLRDRAGVDGPQDPGVVALLLALVAVASLVASPVENGISRALEARADRESIAATRQADVFVEMQRALALRNLNDPSPPAWSQWWFGTHPTVLQRIGLAESVGEEQ